MNLKENLLRGIFGCGYEEPSLLQQRAIIACTKGYDVIAQSWPGTGKTATCVISVLQRVNVSIKETQAIILAPTRELAQQIQKAVLSLGDYMGVSCYVCVGGTNVRQAVGDLKSMKPQIIVGTPGRVSDMLRRNNISSRAKHMLVPDDADRMVGEVFKEQICNIFRKLPTKVQAVVLSANMPADVLEVANRFMKDPKKILVKKEEMTLEGTLQFYVNAEQDKHKAETLCDLYESLTVTSSIIFVNSRRRAVWLAERMTAEDFTVYVLHGEMDQSDRNVVTRQFRSGSNQVLITTDRPVGGMDLQRVSLLINYDLPANLGHYTHRIGRDSRYGRKRAAISLVTKHSQHPLFNIHEHYRSTIEELPRNMDDLL